MEKFDKILDVLYIVIPSATVLYGMYLVVKTFVNKEMERSEKKVERSQLELRKKAVDHVMPNRLQAYERICLLLERISVNNLVIRVNNAEFNVAILHSRLLAEIRSEFNHNLSQQIYVSDEAWTLVKKAIEETTALINQAYGNIAEKDQKGFELAKTIFNIQSRSTTDSVEEALLFLKQEIRKNF